MIKLIYNTPNSPVKTKEKLFKSRAECDAYITKGEGLVWVVSIESSGKAVAESLNKLFGG